MQCKGCPKPIKKNERTHVETEDGKLVATWHLKCWHTHLKRKRWEKQGRSRETVTPYDKTRTTRDEVEALAARQAELEEQRALEETPKRFDDWRMD